MAHILSESGRDAFNDCQTVALVLLEFPDNTVCTVGTD